MRFRLKQLNTYDWTKRRQGWRSSGAGFSRVSLQPWARGPFRHFRAGLPDRAWVDLSGVCHDWEM